MYKTCGWGDGLVAVMGLVGGSVFAAESTVAEKDGLTELREEVAQLKLQLDDTMAKLEAASAGESKAEGETKQPESKPVDAEQLAQMIEQQKQLQERVEALLERVDSMETGAISSPFDYRYRAPERNEEPAAVTARYATYNTGQVSNSYVPAQAAPRTSGPVVYAPPVNNYYTVYTPAYYRGYYGTPAYYGGYRAGYWPYYTHYPHSSVSFGYIHGRSFFRYSTGVRFGCP